MRTKLLIAFLLFAAVPLFVTRHYFWRTAETTETIGGTLQVLDGVIDVDSPLELGASPSAAGAGGSDRSPLSSASPLVQGRGVDRSPDAVVALSGRVEIPSLPGVLREDMDGRARLSLRSGSKGYAMDLEIVDGEFEATLQRLDDGRLDRGGGRTPVRRDVEEGPVRVSEPDLPELGAFRFVAGDDVNASGRWSVGPFGTTGAVMLLEPCPELLLHVLDDATGTPLSGVEVVGSSSPTLVVSQHPQLASTQPYGVAGQSPFALTAPLGHRARAETFVVARAPGYAWALATVSPRDGGEHTVRLRPGGELSVSLRGDLPDDAFIAVRIPKPRAPGGGKLRGPFPESGTLTIESLPVGPLTVAIEARRRTPLEPAYAEVEAEVIAGAATAVVLDLGSSPSLPPVALSGTLLLPAHWDENAAMLLFRRHGPSLNSSQGEASLRVRDLSAIEGRERAYAFELPELEPGEWFCELRPRYRGTASGWHREFELPPGGLSGFEVAPPEAVRVTVQVLDESTGELIVEPSVYLDRVRQDRWIPGLMESWELEPSQGDASTVEALVIPGTFHVHARAEGFASTNSTLTFEGPRDVTLKIAPAISARLRYTDGGKVVRGVFWTGLTLTGPGGEELEMLNIRGGGDPPSYGFAVTAAGRYRLSFPEMEGYERPLDVEFEMVPGETTELEIKLVAAPR